MYCGVSFQLAILGLCKLKAYHTFAERKATISDQPTQLWDRSASAVPLHFSTDRYASTLILTRSIAAWPDLRNGRGIGWACPFSSIVRHRKVYSPAGRPGNRMAQ